MLKTVIVLPDGTELSSGQGEHNAIQSTSIIECVNSGEELTIGSTCANSIQQGQHLYCGDTHKSDR